MLFRLSGCFFCKMHYSEHLTLFITISRCYIRYTRKTVFRTSCKIIPISLYSITISWTRLFTNSGHEKKLIPNIRSHIRMFGRGETKANSPDQTELYSFASSMIYSFVLSTERESNKDSVLILHSIFYHSYCLRPNNVTNLNIFMGIFTFLLL